MQQDEETSPVTTDRPQTTMWSWLKSPWLLLILGSVTALLLWVGCGVWIEHRRATVLAELRATPGIAVSTIGIGRSPIWMPAWLEDQIPDAWVPEIDDEPLFVEVIEPLTERKVNLLLRLPAISIIQFMEGSHVSDEALQALCQTHHFRVVTFDPPRHLTHEHYEALARNPNLEGLWNAAGPFDQTALHELGRMQQLTSLTLRGSLAGAARGTALGRLPDLRILTWHDSQLTDEQLPDLVGFSSLGALKLYQTQLTGRSWVALGSLRLHTLHLESPHIDDRLADELSRNPELNSLKLTGGQFSDRALRTLLESGLRQFVETETRELSLETAKLIGEHHPLASLIIRGSVQIDDEILKAMANKELSELSILNSSITDAGLEHLASYSSLTTAGLANSRITDRGLKVLSELKNLTHLDLSNTAITDDGLRQYYLSTDFMSLKELRLGGTQVSAPAVKEFQQKHPKLVVYGVEGIKTDDDPDLSLPIIPRGWRH